MAVIGNRFAQQPQSPASVAFRSEEHGALVVIQSGDAETLAAEVPADFGSDQPAGSGDES
jgi:hypothetical protein